MKDIHGTGDWGTVPPPTFNQRQNTSVMDTLLLLFYSTSPQIVKQTMKAFTLPSFPLSHELTYPLTCSSFSVSHSLQSRRRISAGIWQWSPSTTHCHYCSDFKNYCTMGMPVIPPCEFTLLALKKSKSFTPTTWCSACKVRSLRTSCITKQCSPCMNHLTVLPFLKNSSGNRLITVAVWSSCTEKGHTHQSG